MQSDPFFVSVIIPVYNGETFLAEAVESVQQLNYHPLEILIVDDGSTDGTAGIAKSFQGDVRYVYQQNQGPAAARNTGLKMARGNIIAFLDADDLWPKNKLEIQLACLAANPSVEIVGGYIKYMPLSDSAADTQLLVEFAEPIVSFHLGGAIFRKSVFDRIGLFDEKLRYSEDVDWFMRAWEKGVSMVVLKQVTLFYRRHLDSMTYGTNLHDLNFIQVLKKSLDRRRQQSNGSAAPLPGLSYLDEPTGKPTVNRFEEGVKL
jgi:glycosyltransferase involved in cell wall biosynthesis